MVLANDNNIIESNHIGYFKEMFNNGISVVLLNEEYIFECLSQTISIKTEVANSLLGHAIVQVSISKGAVYQAKQNNPLIIKKLLDNGMVATNERYLNLFFTIW